jgi:ABC-type uncharacterized transport system ATPase subunit
MSTIKTNRTEKIMELNNISKSFGGLKAVKDVCISVQKGEIHCLIGPNGAGKSTIFKLIVGYHRPDHGQVIYKGKDITRLKPFQRSRLGLSIKFQTPSVYQDLTVRQNLAISLQLHFRRNQIEAEINQKLALLGLQEIGDCIVKNISHGQRQWLEIGMALSTNPDLLLLDEPTAGMSPEETQKTAGIVLELNKTGMTVVAIEHDMEFVRTLNPNITVLHLGQFFAEGSLAEIENNEQVRQIYLGKR